MSVAAVGSAAAAVGGAYLSSKGAKDAANAQADAASAANGLTNAQYQQTRSDNMPFLVNGTGANNQLAYLLGLSPTKGSSAQSLGNAQLVGPSGGKNDWLYNNNEDYRAAWDKLANAHFAKYGQGYDYDSNYSAIETSLRELLAPQIASEKQRLATESANAPSDPQYGSLTRKFSQSDLDNDVVYKTGLQFGLDNGNQAINRQASASGNMLSGATLKALTRFGNDYGSTKANDSYNRYTNDQNNTYNRLAGLSSAGQVATNQVAGAGQNMANTVSNNLVGVGNARGASSIAQGNAWGNALSGIYNNYQTNQLLNGANKPQNYSGWAGMGGFGDSYSTSYGE